MKMLTPGQIIVQQLMEAHGLSQDRLSRKLKVARLSVHQLAIGKRSITPRMAFLLAKLSGQPVEDTARYLIMKQMEYDFGIELTKQNAGHKRAKL